MTTPTPQAHRAAAAPAPRATEALLPRPVVVYWSVQAAAKDAALQRVNAQQASSCQSRKLGCEDDPELFFNDAAAARREAQRICWDCPVRRSCLQRALETEAKAQTSNGTYSNGTVGGVTAPVRERLVRNRRGRRSRRGAVDVTAPSAPERFDLL